MEDSYETGETDSEGADGRSGCVVRVCVCDPDDRIPAQTGSGMWTSDRTGDCGMAYMAYVPSFGHRP